MTYLKRDKIMATLETIASTIDTLHGDMTYRSVFKKGMNYLAEGRRANHDFIVKSNVRTLRSGPNRGKARVDGVTIVMFGRYDRSIVKTAVVRDSSKFLSTLDNLAYRFGDR